MKYFLGRAAWWLPSLAMIASCSVYDSSLVGTSSGNGGTSSMGGGSGPGTGGTNIGGMPSTTTSTGGGGAGGTISSSSGGGGAQAGGGGAGGSVGCTMPTMCPGMDTDCKTRTCDANVCGAKLTGKGTGCTEIANGVCDGNGKCVECVGATQCPLSHICSANDTCATATCSDGVTNGDETDTDCGGSCPKKCPFNDHCMAPADCKGGVCTGNVCVASCTDGAKNGDETDTDCGGSCPKCPDGDHCMVPGDCTSGTCTGGFCSFVLLISEVKSRGVGGGNDEFVELYNPTSAEIVLDASWSIEVRSYSAGSYTVKPLSSGVHIPSHHHYLLAGSKYPGGTLCGTCPATPCGGVACADFNGLPGIGDAGSIAILHSGAVVDAVCFDYSASTQNAITGGIGYVCEGSLASNLPHNDGTTGGSNSDVSIERKPGGAAGNATDSDDNGSDFNVDVPSTPQNLASPATP